MTIKKFFFFIILNILLSGFHALLPVDFEGNISLGIGKRFSDTFDSVWPNIVNDKTVNPDLINTRELTYYRESFSFSGAFYMSPFFTHYFGISCYGFMPYRPISVIQEINDENHNWTLDIFMVAPSLAYKYYPFAESLEEEKFYISAEAGVSILWMQINHSYSSATVSGAELYTFAQNIAPRVAIKAGTKFDITDYMKFYVEAGVDVSRFDDLEAQGDINGSIAEISLKNSSTLLLAANESVITNFDGFDTTVLWVSQVVINLGLSFVF